MNSLKLQIYKCITMFLPETRCFGLKSSLLRWSGAKVGAHVRINSSAMFCGTGALEIGDDVWIGPQCFLSPILGAGIYLGSHIDLAPGVMILNGSHQIEPDGEHMGGQGIVKPVSVGDGCWLGARSLILPGVTLAEKTVVAAGAVVIKSQLLPQTLLAGVPAEAKKAY